MKKYLFIFSLLLVVSIPYETQALTSACSPKTVKPTKEETRLASIATSPDIVQVGGLVTIQVTSKAGNGGVHIDIPNYFELVDYSPKTISASESVAKAGDWNSPKGLPEDIYSVTLKAKTWTNYQWKPMSYSAYNNQGTGYGSDNFYIYYDKIPLELNLEKENQAPQPTKQVIRKIDIKALPETKITLQTNKGNLGPNISQKSGETVSLQANSEGKTFAFLFAAEGDNITLFAESPDSCQNSKITQTFQINRSDTARTYTNYAWIYWLVGIIIVLLLLLFLWILRKKRIDNINKQQIIDQNTNLENKIE